MSHEVISCIFFFFQAEDGIRDYKVTGVQTCALPIFVAACGGDASHVTDRDVYAAAMADGALAREFWTDATRYLVMAVANYVTLVNPRMLVLGGGVIETVPALFDAVTESVPKLTTVLSANSLQIARAQL